MKKVILVMALAVILMAIFTTNGFTTTPPPLIICPQDITIQCDASTDPSNTGYPTVQDNGFDNGTNITLTYSDTVTPGTCLEESTITRTWTATDANGNADTCVQTIGVVDTIPPVIQCNAPATITPSDAPITFIATATDNCEGAPSVDIIRYDCFKFTQQGKRIDKTESCIAEVNGDTISVVNSGGVNDNITWTVRATDNCGNVSEATCSIIVVNPGQQ